MTSALLPAILVIAVAGLFMKTLLFGKLKHKFLIDEVNTNLNFLKYISILFFIFGVGAAFLFSLSVGIWLTPTLEGICLILLIVIFFPVFPKKKHQLQENQKMVA